MQIQKIKSIQHNDQYLKDSSSDHKQESLKQSFIKQEFYSRQISPLKKLKLQQYGKIIKNSVIQPVGTPKSKNKQSIQYLDAQMLPQQSINKKLIRNIKQVRPIQKIQQNDKKFHQFIESSRILAEQMTPKQQINNQTSINVSNFKNITNNKNKKPQLFTSTNYSKLIQQFKHQNPENQDILPEINLRDISIPQLPIPPHADMNQQQLLVLAKQTYAVFGINIQAQEKQLCVKKYKNCVLFSIGSNQYILWHFSGRFYMGGWKQGQKGQGEKHGQGLQIIPDRHIYQGQFINGKKHGSGIMKSQNGNIYDGQWVDGNKNGHGVYFDASTKILYSGQWKQNRKDGQGYLRLSQKQYYYGTFIKNVKEGYGIQLFSNGDKYKGEYQGGKFNGKGKYIWVNGSCYEGQFVQGVRHGEGIWRSAKENADVYIGSYSKDKKNGYGRYVWANGCSYEGQFLNDAKHGNGRITYQDGRQIKGQWKDGGYVQVQQKRQKINQQDLPLKKSNRAQQSRRQYA